MYVFETAIIWGGLSISRMTFIYTLFFCFAVIFKGQKILEWNEELLLLVKKKEYGKLKLVNIFDGSVMFIK